MFRVSPDILDILGYRQGFGELSSALWEWWEAMSDYVALVQLLLIISLIKGVAGNNSLNDMGIARDLGALLALRGWVSGHVRLSCSC